MYIPGDSHIPETPRRRVLHTPEFTPHVSFTLTGPDPSFCTTGSTPPISDDSLPPRTVDPFTHTRPDLDLLRVRTRSNTTRFSTSFPPDLLQHVRTSPRESDSSRDRRLSGREESSGEGSWGSPTETRLRSFEVRMHSLGSGNGPRVPGTLREGTFPFFPPNPFRSPLRLPSSECTGELPVSSLFFSL